MKKQIESLLEKYGFVYSHVTNTSRHHFIKGTTFFAYYSDEQYCHLSKSGSIVGILEEADLTVKNIETLLNDTIL